MKTRTTDSSRDSGRDVRFPWTLVLCGVLLGAPVACDSETMGVDSGGGSGGESSDLTRVEDDLLLHINAERVDAALPALVRDPGLDTIMAIHGEYMTDQHELTHVDAEGRDAEGRARFYGDDPSVRCSEIIQWWGGTPDGLVHYDGYFNSPDHHAAYMEEGLFNLGPTSNAGVIAIAGTGPAGSQFQGRSGSYTAVMLCDRPVTVD